jgi:DNA-binding NarL/FixJ family response regulator
MGRQFTIPAAEQTASGSAPSLTADECRELVCTLGLSPRQARIVELILAGKKDKQIAAALGLKRCTVRTYLGRIFIRVGVTDRMGLAACLLANCLRNPKYRQCHPSG